MGFFRRTREELSRDSHLGYRFVSRKAEGITGTHGLSGLVVAVELRVTPDRQDRDTS